MPQNHTPAAPAISLPAIPVFHVGQSFALETTLAVGARGYDLLDRATAGIPTAAIRIGDAISSAWLRRVRHPNLAELNTVAAVVKRPGTYYFNVHYEWGCTSAAKPSGTGQGACLVRVLDWKTPGLGRHIVAACVMGAKGPWVTLTWPGYTGVLQAMAKGRFAAGLNQAPARVVWGRPPLDWLVAKSRILRSTALTAPHLLRQAFEQAASYADAKALLTTTPVAAPVIYTLAGPGPGESCVIERLETEARVLEGPAMSQTANDWQTASWQGRRRPGRGSDERLAAIQNLARAPSFERPFDWLTPPILNDQSRLAIIADPATGRLTAQGYEADGPATAVLHLQI